MIHEMLKLIETDMGHGIKRQVANRSKMSYATVIKCFKGECTNAKVLETAMEIYLEHKNKISQMAEMLEKYK